MKKVLTFISSLLLLGSAMFADVTVKKLDDGKVEVTFFYPNPRATEVVVAGDFTDWQNGAEAMTKGDKGFTLTKVFPAGTTLKYKFISDGNWTEDMHAPERVDDGFGGHNGIVDCDALATGGSSESTGAKKPSLKFMTWSNVGLQNKWSTVNTKDDGKSEADFEEASAGIGVKSYWKVTGNVHPNVPLYMEVAFAENDGFENLYKKDSLDFDDGMKRFGVDMLSDPIAYMNGKATGSGETKLGHFKTGIETPWLNWSMGWKYAKMSPHNNLNWNTVDKDWDAGYDDKGGFSVFSTGYRVAETVADLTNGAVTDLEVVYSPNRTANRSGSQYGMYAIADAKIKTGSAQHYVDFQFNGAFGSEYDKVFDEIYENDFIFGYGLNLGPVALKANYLLNAYGDQKSGEWKAHYTPASSDVGATDSDPEYIQDNMALNANATYSNDKITVNAGYRFRGEQANLMYMKHDGSDEHIKDQLGTLNAQRIFGEVKVTPTEAVTVGVTPYVEMNFNTDSALHAYANKDTKEIVVRPFASYKISDTMTVDGHIEGKYITEDEDKYVQGKDTTNFILSKAGLHFNTKLDSAVSEIDVKYGYKGDEEQIALHNLLVSAEVPFGVTVQAGLGLRTAYNSDVDLLEDAGINPFGFALGAKKQISKNYNTILATQFCYNLDPFNDFGDGWGNFKLSDYVIDRDANAFASAAAFRVGLQFDF